MARAPKALTQKEVTKRMRTLAEEWQVNKRCTEISRTFSLATFVTALAFVAKITVHAEILGHHPDIELSYGKVKVKLKTHDVKGLTTKDFGLAKRIDKLTVA